MYLMDNKKFFCKIWLLMGLLFDYFIIINLIAVIIFTLKFFLEKQLKDIITTVLLINILSIDVY